jgi:solute carrier family 35 (UDP-galactose transporter), member B1
MSYLQLAICTGGIYASYLAYGVFQESLYRTQADGSVFAATAFVLMVQCATNAIVSFFVDVFFGHLLVSPKKGAVSAPSSSFSWINTIPTVEVASTSLVYVMAMYLSNEALQYVSYPTQALAKSCKMIPVMLGRVLYLRKSYSWLKYTCVIMMTIGITIFQMNGKSKSSHARSASSAGSPSGGYASSNMLAFLFENGESFGLVLLGLSLCLDGITGPMQEGLKKLQLSNNQQIVVNNIWAVLFMLIITFYLGQFNSSIIYLQSHPSVLKTLLYFSLCSAVGQIFIFYTIRTFDSLTLSTITTTRKFFTIVMSVFLHGHDLATVQWAAVGIVFAGLSLEVVDSENEKKKHLSEGKKTKL